VETVQRDIEERRKALLREVVAVGPWERSYDVEETNSREYNA
jgi:hypothetical protein